MKTVDRELTIEFIEKKSKFLGHIKPVNTVKEAQEYIEYINTIHPDATHNVYAYKVIENGQEYFKYNDCGEPLNTAGKPMAEIITRLDVFNVVIVATRYFGGIKLGAGGLIRNYAKCAKLAINEANIVEYVEKSIYLLDYDYSKSKEIDIFFEKNNIEVLEKMYNERISVKILINNDLIDILEKMNDIIIIKL